MPNSAARRTGGAERWAPPAAQLSRARRRQDRSRHRCPPPGLPAPGSQEPRHGCLLLDADRWVKPCFCLALKTRVPKAALLPVGRGWSWQGLAPRDGALPSRSLPRECLSRSCSPAAGGEEPPRFACVRELLFLNQFQDLRAKKGWLLDEDEWLRRHTVIESGLEETN